MKQQTDGELQSKFGKMVKGINSILLEEGQLSDTQNMRPGFWWKQRKGMATLTATPVASGLRWKRFTQFRTLNGDTDVLLAHTYDASGGEDLYEGSALPPNAITWTKKYDLTADCETAQFANVAEAVLMANNKDFLIWRGNVHKPTGAWLYDHTPDTYINTWDEMTDNDPDTIMTMDTFAVTDFIYVLSEMPLDTIWWTLKLYNSTVSNVVLKKWNGAWTQLDVADGTVDATGIELDDTFDGGTFDSDRWTELDTESDLVCNDRYEFNTDAGPCQISSVDKVMLTGDFDISVAFDLGTEFANGGGTAKHQLRVEQTTDPEDNYTYMEMRRGASQQYAMYGESGGSGQTFDTDNQSDMTGFLRITRVGSSISAYYGSATGGTLMRTYTSNYTGDVYVILYSVCGTDPDAWDGPATFDNLQTNVATYKAIGPSLGQDGAMSWTLATDEVKTTLEGIPGYLYQIGWDVTLDSSLEVNGMTVHSPWNTVKNIWDGTHIPPTGCYVTYDDAIFRDAMAYVNNTSQSQFADLSALDDAGYFYVGFSQQVSQINIWPADLGLNDATSIWDRMYYMKNTGVWTDVGASFNDTTVVGSSTLAQKGHVSWAVPDDEIPCKIAGDDSQMYWYRFIVDDDNDPLADPTLIYYIQGVPVADDPDYSYGVFAYKRRAWQIAPKDDENALRYSGEDLPNVWSGIDTGYVYFGERPLKAAAPFYNESVVYADTEIWMLQGNSPSNFGRLRLSGKVGISAPASLISIESGAPIGDKIKVVLGWFFYDGIWLFDGTRIWKVSDPDVSTFFDPDHEDYINPAYMDQTQGEYDFETQCAYWIVYSGVGQTTPNKVIIMHFPTMTFGVFAYGVDIGALCSAINGRYYLLAGGDACGRFFQLNSGTVDRDSANAEVAVDAYVTTRDMPASFSDGMKNRLFSVWTESQAAGGQIEVDQYPDGSDTPQPVGKASLTTLGKIASIFQWPLKVWKKQALVKFRIRNRSKNARMNLIGHSTTMDKGRLEQ